MHGQTLSERLIPETDLPPAGTRSLFDAAFIRVLVRRLHAAQEALISQRLARVARKAPQDTPTLTG